MSTQPKVSVIFPIYNNEKYIEACVRSVMAQTLRDIELILIDDGSKDGAPAILDRLAAEDDRITVIHKANEGSAVGRNLGMDTAKGEYVAFVESDDSVEPEMYGTLYETAVKTRADIVKCGCYFCENGEKEEKTWFYGVADEGEVFTAKEKPEIVFYHASIWAGIYRRQFLNDNNLRCVVTPSATYSDFSFMAMTCAYAKRITVCHRAFYNYNYENPDSSRVVQGEKCYYKPYHCMQANRIMREAGVFEDVKEELGFHQFRTCMGHARRIRPELRREYFNRVRDMLRDTVKDGYEFRYFDGYRRRWADLILADDFEGFYRQVDKQIRRRKILMKFGDKNAFTRGAARAAVRLDSAARKLKRRGKHAGRLIGNRAAHVGRLIRNRAVHLGKLISGKGKNDAE